MAGDLVLDEPTFPSSTPAEPGFGKGFAERLGDFYAAASPSKIGFDLGSPEGQELMWAAKDATMYTKLISSREEAMSEAAQQRIDAIANATGVKLENPWRGGYTYEAAQAQRQQRFDNSDEAAITPQAIFDSKLSELQRSHADKLAGLDLDTPFETFNRSLISAGQEVATSAEDRLKFAQQGYAAADRSSLGGKLGEIAGTLLGGWRDPLTIASWWGPANVAGKTIAMRVLNEGVTQGLFNLFLTQAEKPAAQSFREERGQPSSSRVLSGEEASHALLFGFLGGVAVRGGVELGGAALRAGQRSVAADRAVIEDRPAGVPDAVHDTAIEQAVAHVNDPVRQPPPALVFEPKPIEPAAIGVDRLAELRNIAARATDPMDVVESMRLARELADAALATGDQNLTEAAKLATLSEPAWQAVREGTSSPEHGLIVAEQAANPADHAPALERLRNATPADPQEARLIAADEVAARANQRSVAAVTQTAKPKRLPGRVADEDMSMLQYLITTGGLKETPDLLAIFGGENPWVRPYGKLFKATGRSLDDATELLRSEGFLHDPDAGHGLAGASYDQAARDVGHHQLLAALQDNPHALRQGRLKPEPRDAARELELREQARAERETTFDAAMGEHQIKSTKALRQRALAIMAEDSQVSALDAYERAQLQHETRNAEQRRARQADQSDIPFDSEAELRARDAGGASPQSSRDTGAISERPGDAGDGGRAGATGARPGDRGGQQDRFPGFEPEPVKSAQGELALAGGDAEAAIREKLRAQMAAPARGGRGRDKRGALLDENAQRDVMDLVPSQRADGSTVLIPPEEVPLAGERQSLFADLARSCQN